MDMKRRLHITYFGNVWDRYVKEFVHGDFGRTVPSICSMLGKRADIFQLDVRGIKY
jgi:tRNA U54 and U55 pseudouridine synthase Pus10